MGTSSSNLGPRPGGSLLPPDAPPPPEDPELADTGPADGDGGAAPEEDGEGVEINSPTPPAWPAVKTAFGSWASMASGDGREAALRAAMKKFVAAQGGGRKAAHASPSGRATFAGFAGFLADAGKRGTAQALHGRGISGLAGRSIEEVVAELADIFLPSNGTDEDGVARRAVIETLVEVMDDEGKVKDFLNCSADEISAMLRAFLVNYIHGRLLHAMGHFIHKRAEDPGALDELEAEMRDYVKTAIEHSAALNDLLSGPWTDATGPDEVQRLFSEAFKIFGEGP